MSEDRVFKALADINRRHLLDHLYQNNGQTLSQLCECLEIKRQSVSQHLKILEDANLISVVWEGREKYHFLNPVPLHEIYIRWVKKFELKPLDYLHELKSSIEGEQHD